MARLWPLAGAGVVLVLAEVGCGARSDLAASLDRGGGGAPATSASSSLSTSISASASSSAVSSSQSSSSSSQSSSSSSQSSSSSSQSSSSSASSASAASSSASSSSSGPLCHTAADCDDGIACTDDVCDPTTDTCRHVPCDSKCAGGTFCAGVERCDATRGCTTGPLACDLGFACSADVCDESNQRCAHMQSSGCVPPVLLVVADATGALFSVSPYGGDPTPIAPSTGAVHLDVAILGGRWFAIDSSALVELVPKTNQVKASFAAPPANSLCAGPDGKLYAADRTVYRLDPDTGVATALGALPPGYRSSGDIAFLGGRLLVSTDGPCGGALIAFDTSTGASEILGGTGLDCVYGLAVSGGTLFLLSCDGRIGSFDPSTGAAQVLSTPALSVYGADALP